LLLPDTRFDIVDFDFKFGPGLSGGILKFISYRGCRLMAANWLRAELADMLRITEKDNSLNNFAIHYLF